MEWFIKIERAHRAGERNEDMSRTIVSKTKELILKNARKLKDIGYYINEDFFKRNSRNCKRKLKEGWRTQKECKYAILLYDI